MHRKYLTRRKKAINNYLFYWHSSHWIYIIPVILHSALSPWPHRPSWPGSTKLSELSSPAVPTSNIPHTTEISVQIFKFSFPLFRFLETQHQTVSQAQGFKLMFGYHKKHQKWSHALKVLMREFRELQGPKIDFVGSKRAKKPSLDLCKDQHRDTFRNRLLLYKSMSRPTFWYKTG